MQRGKYFGKKQARQDLGSQRTQPLWLEQSHSLPFQFLSDDEFEIFCYLLLLKEHPKDRIFYYGKTGDGGRDIVWVKTDNSIKLIQCKNFQNRIGITEVKSEIAKIYVNCYKKIIPESPHQIEFYVSSDFTPKALSIIQHPTEWSKLSKVAFEKYLKQKPDRALLDFSSEWKPIISYETGLTLTERARKYSDLIDEFFRIRKVTDNTEIQKTNCRIEEINSSLNEQNSNISEILEILKSGRVPLNFQCRDDVSPLIDLLRKAEENTPGVCFKSEIDASGSVYLSIFAKPGHGGKPLCNLTFPDTKLGKKGAEKFRSFVEKGYNISLKNGEFILDYLIPLPFQNLGKNENRIIKIEHPSLHHKIPVRLEILDNEEITEKLELSYLQFTRAGTKEIEVVIEGGNFVGKAVGIISITGQSQSHWNFCGKSEDLSCVKAPYAKASIALALNILNNKKVRVVLLEDPETTVELGGAGLFKQPNVSEDYLKVSYQFLDNLIKINRKFGIDLRHPGHLQTKDINQAEMIVAVIEGSTISWESGKSKYLFNRQELLQVMDFLKKVASVQSSALPTMADSEKLNFEFLGYNTPEVESEIIYEGVRFINTLAEFEHLASTTSDGVLVELEFEFERATQRFSNWL